MIVAECQEVWKIFQSGRDTTVALRDVSLKLSSGEFAAVIGPSGSGKTTLLNLFGGLDSPTRGHLRILGEGVTRAAISRLRRGRIGYLFQDGGLIENLSVAASVDMPMVYLGLPAAERQRRTSAILADLEIAHLTRKSVTHLSGGERQRVGLARAMVTRPDLLICDEPTAALDAETSRFIVGRLKSYCAGGGAVLCSSHDGLVAEAASRHILVDRGLVRCS